MPRFILLTIFGFLATELFSYFVHRFVFHGVLWRVHQTHHHARHGKIELNDIFSLIFAAISMSLMICAESPFAASSAFPFGLGIALYGLLYFIIHDIFTHRRFFSLNTKNKILLTVRAAHQRHHQSAEKDGLEPFGLFLFDFQRFKK